MIYKKIFGHKLTISECHQLIEKFDYTCMYAPKSLPERFLGDASSFNKIQNELRPCIFLGKVLSIEFIELIKDTQSQFDVKLYFANGNMVEVECVTAMNHQDLALRREHMDLFGRAPVFGEIIKTPGSKNKRVIQNTPPTTISYDEALRITKDEFYNRIPKAFEKKLNKQIKDKIYQNTILVIYVDDKYYLLDPSSLNEYLIDISYKIKAINHDFKGIYIVSSSGNVISTEPYCE